MSKYSHVCIKPVCGKTYEDDEQDAYYCPECVERNKQIAQEIDKKLAGKKSNRKGQSFNEQVSGMKVVKGITFINLPN